MRDAPAHTTMTLRLTDTAQAGWRAPSWPEAFQECVAF